MITNQIRELREERGLSQERLGDLTGTNKFKISRVENGDTRLDLDLAVKIAAALDVDLGDVLGLKTGGAGGMAEDAAAYDPNAGDPLAGLVDALRCRSLYRVKSDVLDETGINPGDVLLIDYSAAAVKGVKPLSIVIVQLYDSSEMLSATTLLRQWVPPNLLITNSRAGNQAPLNMTTTDAHIKGVVISRHHQLSMGLPS